MNYKHGAASAKGVTAEYNVWSRMRARCANKRNPYYGGRGITVCPRWKDFASFLQDVGPRPGPGFTLDRKDNTKGYSPENCHWVRHRENCLNKSNTHALTYNGVTRPLLVWAAIHGLTYSCLRSRILRGWSVEDALLTPTDTSRRP